VGAGIEFLTFNTNGISSRHIHSFYPKAIILFRVNLEERPPRLRLRFKPGLRLSLILTPI
jgi:hypothetical protein